MLRATVASEGLNLRRAPIISSCNIVDQLARGDRLDVLEGDPGSPWIKVRVRRTGMSGYVATKFLTIDHIPDVPPPRPQLPQTHSRDWVVVAVAFAAVLMVGLLMATW